MPKRIYDPLVKIFIFSVLAHHHSSGFTTSQRYFWQVLSVFRFDENMVLCHRIANMAKVAVTGGAGFIGSNLTPQTNF
jgi:hypothetical protein